MNDDRSGGTADPSEAETVQPNKELGGWEMPAPTFQQTSGYLPQGYLGKVGLDGDSAVAQAAPTSPTTSPNAEAPTGPVNVEAQPDLSEQIAEPPPEAAAKAAPGSQRSNTARVVLILFGVAGMIVFIAAFLAAVWYLFLRPADGGSPF
jgi:hypothetical protein